MLARLAELAYDVSAVLTHPPGTNMNDNKLDARRNFLRFLAGSPLLASLPTAPGFCDELDLENATLSDLISEANEAIDVFDFERVAEQELPTAHWGYLKSGVDDDGSVLANRMAFSKYYMRPRRLVGVSKIDMSVELFGTKWETPIALCPAGSQGAFHEDGELAVAQAAKKKRHLMILSTTSSNSVGDVAEAGRRLTEGKGNRFILTDTVFSMDGDLAPLEALKAHGADVVIDDVHGLGVFGKDGRGNLDFPIQSGNLSKACGSAGGFIVGPKDLIELVRSRARSFLFTTAPPPALCAAGMEALRLVREAGDQRTKLWDNVRRLGAASPIHTVILGSNERALEASARLWEQGFFVPAIRPPTVAPGTARLRVTVTAMHDAEHVEALKDALGKI